MVDREDAAGLAIDMIGGGETPTEEGLDAAIKKGEADFLGRSRTLQGSSMNIHKFRVGGL
jgi:hypothetical protein